MNTAIQVIFYALIVLFLFLNRLEFRKMPVVPINSLFRKIGLGGFIVSGLLLLRVWFVPGDEWSKAALLGVFLVNWLFVCKRLEWSNKIIQGWLLYWTVFGTTLLNTSESAYGTSAVLIALVAFKLIENFLLSGDNNFEDILPSCVWLTALIWAAVTGKEFAQVGNLVLSCLSVALVLKWLPGKFTLIDKYFLKRLGICAAAGLVLFLIQRMALMPDNLVLIAGLFAVSAFSSYYFQTVFNKDEVKFLIYAAGFLLTLGTLTLVGTRLMGDSALLVLAAACCMHSGQALLYVFFWISRLLIQAFVISNVANVTGINLMHPYCSAALYFGFLAIVFISVLLHISNYKTVNLIACLLLSLILPAALIYLIHEEAIASFLLAANVAAISLVTFSPMFFKKPADDYQFDLAALPVLLGASSLLSAPLVELGNHATVALRFQIALYSLIVLVLISFTLSKVRRLSANPV